MIFCGTVYLEYQWIYPKWHSNIWRKPRKIHQFHDFPTKKISISFGEIPATWEIAARLASTVGWTLRGRFKTWYVRWKKLIWLVVWLSSILFSQKNWECKIIPILTNSNLFQRGGPGPPTTNQMISMVFSRVLDGDPTVPVGQQMGNFYISDIRGHKDGIL